MKNTLKNFPTEKLILHKPSGDTYKVEGMVESSEIQSDDVTVPIEPNDYFERNLPNGIIEYYKVIDPGFYKGMQDIPDHYQTKVQRIAAPIVYKTEDDNSLPHMIFISHSSKDKEYTKAFVDLLFDIGLNEDDIVCSSYPGLGVPLRASIYEWLVEKFQECDLHVFYFLSHNYYKSAASLNEMGAAWALKQKWDGILLPGFSFAEITGCIDPSQIGIKLDGDIDELKHRLGELKDDIVEEFGLRAVSTTRWERIRNEFIDTIQKIIPTEEHLQDVEHTPTLGAKRDSITIYACIMLMYAASSDGIIMVVSTLGYTSYQAGAYNMERNQDPRELALWEDAVSQLIAKGYIKRTGRKNQIYQVTAEGYNIADAFREQNGLDPSRKPAETLLKFGEKI